MNREAWQHVVSEARNGNTALFNKAVTSNFQEHFYKSILKTVQEKDLTREIYNSTMLKFWERFIINGEDLPESNIDGYIFQMSRNAFYEIRRQRSNKRNLNTVSMESQDIIEKFKAIKNEGNHSYGNTISEEQDLKMHRVLFQTVQKLDKVCQQIIHQHVMEEETLVKLKEELSSYGSYNAIVQKKKRCIDSLRRLINRAVKEKKFILPYNS